MLTDSNMLSPLSLSMHQLSELVQAEQSELTLLQREIDQQKRQLLLSNADDALARYERMFAVTPSPLATIAERQNALIAKFNSRANATVATIKEIVEIITGNQCDIVEHYDQYRFDVTIALDNPNSAVSVAEIHRQIDSLKPAHLAYNLSMISVHQAVIGVGVLVSQYKEVTI